MKRVIATTLLLAAVLMTFPTLAGADDKGWGWGGLRQQRLEVGRALLEVQSSNLPSILPYYTEDIEYHDPVVDIYGLDSMTAFLFRLFGSSPDLITTIEDETLSNGVYTATWTMVGQFAGVPYSAKGISILKFKGWTAQVHYQRDYYTEGDIMANIPGLDAAISGFRTYYRCAVDPTFDCPLEEGGTAAASTPTVDTAVAEKGFGWIRNLIRLRRERLEIGRALVEINGTNWQSLLPYYAQDYEYHDPIVDIYGFDTLVPFFARLFISSPDLVTTVEDETLVDGVYMATWTMSGLFNGVPFSAPGMSIVKFEDWSTRTYYSRDYYTEGDIMATIPGLDEAVLGFRTFYRCAVDPTFDCPLEETGTPFGPGVASATSDLPRTEGSFALRQNAPNPFNPATEISFVVPDGGSNVTLRVYDLTGRLVRTLVDGYQPSGTQTVSWFGRNDQGLPVASGTYFYQLTAPSFSEKRKMVLLK